MYLVSVVPLVLASAVTPTLQDAALGAPVAAAALRVLRPEPPGGRWWTAVLYMFVHNDQEHLFANMFALAITAAPVLEAFGAHALYSIYFGGGVLSALDRRGRLRELRRFLGHQLAVDDSAGYWLPKQYNRLTRYLGSLAAPHLVGQQHLIGASAGVCSVSGVLLCLLLEKLWAGTAPTGGTLMRLLCCLQPLLMDVQSYGTSNVSHVLHLDGFAFGVLWYCGACALTGVFRRPGSLRRAVDSFALRLRRTLQRTLRRLWP
eukprot:TRINITY_DN8529_c0_g1_i1.p1 TRINITY_DN8529_c0_g1~~TRINITY_DN8529_c0_g1_i1.p1  ORF type:complete len:275 (-),score=45.02 TRINITY_DN8529_c0_g1_i1:44-826(-)